MSRAAAVFYCICFGLCATADPAFATIGPRGKSRQNNDVEVVDILMWSGGSWAGFLHGDVLPTPNYLGHKVHKTAWNNGTGCPVQCQFTTDKSKASTVDAIVFEAQPFANYYDGYRRNPPQVPAKLPGQSWVNHGYEQPAYFNLYEDPGYLDYIDINATYYLESQVPLSFTCLWGGVGYDSKTKVPTTDVFLKPPPPKSKKRNVVFMSTNCASGGAAYRTEYVHELMQYLEIDSFGRCLHTRDMPANMRAPIYSDHGASMRNKIGVFQNYKFVLTFENNNVTDYVTEKMINVLQAGSVPVYMGSPNVEPYWVPGEKSIIRTDQFSGPQELAEYLTFLNENDDAYMEYFAWKKKGVSAEFQKRFDSCGMYGAECRLCQYIADQRNKLGEGEKKNVELRRANKQAVLGAVRLGGKGGHVRVATTPALSASAFTIKMWIKADKIKSGNGDNDGPILLEMGDAVQLSLQPANSRNRAFVRLCVNGAESSGNGRRNECFQGSRPLVKETFYQITVVWSYKPGPSGDCMFWVNGVADAAVYTPSVDLTSSIINAPSSPLTIGAGPGGLRAFAGMVDDVQVFNYAMDKTSCRKGVYSIPGPYTPGLAGAWLFNHAGGDAMLNTLSNGATGYLNGDGNRIDMPTKPLMTSNPCL